jgi:hypothetical protein
MGDEPKSGLPLAFLAGLLVVVSIIAVIYLVTETSKSTAPAEQHLSLSEADKPYLERIQIGDIQMSRAENLLGHELTYIVGTLRNNGTRNLRDIEVTVEFRDLLNQVILRENRRLFGRNPPVIPGGQSRAFQLTFEGVPKEWNRQYPTFKITGVVLDP